MELPSIRGPVNFTVTSPFVNNSLTASCQLVLDVKVEKFLGGSLKVILTHDKNEVEIRNIPFVTSKGFVIYEMCAFLSLPPENVYILI